MCLISMDLFPKLIDIKLLLKIVFFLLFDKIRYGNTIRILNYNFLLLLKFL